MTTEEGNKLIAEFMNIPFEARDYTDDISMGGNAEAVRYHRDWSWLMPVVEKIETVEYANYASLIGTNICYFSAKNIRGFNEVARGYSTNSKIEAVWQAVVQFITYLNSKQHGAETQIERQVKEGKGQLPKLDEPIISEEDLSCYKQQNKNDTY